MYKGVCLEESGILNVRYGVVVSVLGLLLIFALTAGLIVDYLYKINKELKDHHSVFSYIDRRMEKNDHTMKAVLENQNILLEKINKIIELKVDGCSKKKEESLE